MARSCLTYKNSAVFLHTSLHRGVKYSRTHWIFFRSQLLNDLTSIKLVQLHYKPLGLTTFLFPYEEVTDKRLLNEGFWI